MSREPTRRSPRSLIQDYRHVGLAVAKQAIDPELAAEACRHVDWLRERHPDVRPDQLHHHLLVHDPFIHRLATDSRLTALAGQFIGSDMALFAAHYVAKPPRSRQAVQWHQDGSYWPLEPMEVVSLWLACTDSSPQNGCMRVLPGTHTGRIRREEEMTPLDMETSVLHSGIDENELDLSRAMDVVLSPGDVSVHDPAVIHGSNPNSSDRWRIGLTLRYIPTSTRVLSPDHECILAAGNPHPDVRNRYARTPSFVSGTHMPFLGWDSWVRSPDH